MWYFVEYNGKCLKATKRITPALAFINRKGLQDDADNVLRLVDSQGEMYNPITGSPIEFHPFRKE